jgi:hypothetical protein
MADLMTTLKTLDNSKLIDVVKNYKQYGYDEETRNSAISILEERGVSIQDLKLTGSFENQKFEEANRYYSSFFKNSKNGLILYCVALLSNIVSAYVSNESTIVLTLLLVVSWLSIIGYIVFLIKSLLDHNSLYKLIGSEDKTSGTTMYYILGAPFYFIFYFVFKKKFYREMKTII